MIAQRLAIVALALALLAGCSKEEPVDFVAEEPRPAQPAPPKRGWLVRYDVAKESHIAFSLDTREAKPRGRIDGISGSFSVDLADLTKTTGELHADLMSLQMTTSLDPDEDAERSRVARRWLELGEAAPNRDRHRNATFRIRRVASTSAAAAHEGKLGTEKRSDSAAHEESDESPPEPETRTVRLVVHGELELHGVRVQRTAKLEAVFHYDAPALSGAVPSRVFVKTRRPFLVSLDAHSIEPRNEAGVLVSTSLGLLGTRVARDAKVELELVGVSTR